MNVLRSLVKQYEGLARLARDGLVYPYLCPANYPTRGYGVLVKDMAQPPITPQQADEELDRVMPYYMLEALKAVPSLAKAPSEVWEVIADFTFNLGAARLRSSTLRKKLLAEDWAGARRELMKWVYGGGRKLRGLELRRAAEASYLPR